ncbi:MAG: hypothetical protein ACREP9_02635 [Candidatus Dormibacteraceae bacterium]
MLNFLWLALGVSVLLVAIFISLLLLRLRRTLGAVEQLLATVDETLQEVVPEIRASLGNVNDITAGVNLALQVAGSGATRAGSALGARAEAASRGAAAAGRSVKAGMASVWQKIKGGDI